MTLKVNFSDEEAASKALSFDPVPSGKYHAKITDVTDKVCGPESKNAGKPYWAVEFTVQDGQYSDRKLWSNVMLFDGALYSLSQLLKATDNEAAIKSGKIPDGESFITKDVTLTVRKQRDEYAEAKRKAEGDEDTTPLWKNEVKGIGAYVPSEKVTSGAGSLLP